jgi:hypothetical protein
MTVAVLYLQIACRTWLREVEMAWLADIQWIQRLKCTDWFF